MTAVSILTHLSGAAPTAPHPIFPAECCFQSFTLFANIPFVSSAGWP